jgi:hydroxyacylglutathione hydrolase
VLHVIPIPALTDNYIWLVVSETSGHCVIVDPGEHQPVMEALSLYQLTPTAIFITHHHGDHTNGALVLRDHFELPVFGPTHENINAVTHPLAERGTVHLKELGLTFTILSIPGHTRDHIAYYTSEGGFIFTGDTLFTAACGRLFEGTAAQMHESLNKLARLPDHTLIYCGHEYTENNLKFAHHIEPDNERLCLRIKVTAALRKYGIPTVPAPLFLEKQTNPFLRCNEKGIIQAAERYEGRSLPDASEVFASIRRQKDAYSCR